MPTIGEQDLLNQLNGDGGDAMPPMIDIPGAAAPDRESELTVAPRPAPKPTRAADAVHSTAVGGSGYRIRVKGEYYAPNPDGKGKMKKPYTAEFNIPKLEGALSLIKNRLLKAALKKKHSDFAADRTCYIVEVTPLGANPKSNNLAYMDRGQLEGFVLGAVPAIPIRPDEYATDDDGTNQLREAVIDYVQTPKGFVEREKVRQVKRAEARELMDLNPGLEVETV